MVTTVHATSEDDRCPCCGLKLREAGAEIERLRAALQRIIDMDRRSGGTSSEDHTEWDGPCGKIARSALTYRKAAR